MTFEINSNIMIVAGVSILIIIIIFFLLKYFISNSVKNEINLLRKKLTKKFMTINEHSKLDSDNINDNDIDSYIDPNE